MTPLAGKRFDEVIPRPPGLSQIKSQVKAEILGEDWFQILESIHAKKSSAPPKINPNPNPDRKNPSS
jgi:hypothetical protein